MEFATGQSAISHISFYLPKLHEAVSIRPSFVFLFMTIMLWSWGFIRRVAAPYRIKTKIREESVTPSGPPNKPQDGRAEERMKLHKSLYFKLQHLEDYPEVLPQARDELISLFSECLASALQDTQNSILAVNSYNSQALEDFLRFEHDKIFQQWEGYLARRSAGGERELFKTREEAGEWLKQAAPVKYVDGAWLGHIHKITTPFALRGVTKASWQVLSEELGDGDLNKHHVFLYRKLLLGLGIDLPEADSPDFTAVKHQLNAPAVWRSAVSQLLISLFPNEFLPEILGFNLHYELITLQTLQAAKELAELKIDNYYFLLHISIDNSDTGHTAMAAHAAIRYLDDLRESQGEFAAQQAWKRIQTGYILSERLGGTTSPSSNSSSTLALFPNKHSNKIKQIFRAKATASQKLHYVCPAKIGGKKLVEWLSPEAWESSQSQDKFLDALSNAKPWVKRGNSGKSLLVRSLSWEGKMFGAFTSTELDVLKEWIDSLGALDQPLYWRFVDRQEVTLSEVFRHPDIAVDHPLFPPETRFSDNIERLPGYLSSSVTRFAIGDPLPRSSPSISRFLPLWFAHPCLLENTINTPAVTAKPLFASILRILRAEAGFAAEGDFVAGMDEILRTDDQSLVEIGREISRRAGRPDPQCLKDVLAENDNAAEFAYDLLRWAMRPASNLGLLLGLARAFLDLETWVAESDLLSEKGKAALRTIIIRKAECLDFCIQELEGDGFQYEQLQKGYELGRAEIEKCFEKN